MDLKDFILPLITALLGTIIGAMAGFSLNFYRNIFENLNSTLSKILIKIEEIRNINQKLIDYSDQNTNEAYIPLLPNGTQPTRIQLLLYLMNEYNQIISSLLSDQVMIELLLKTGMDVHLENTENVRLPKIEMINDDFIEKLHQESKIIKPKIDLLYKELRGVPEYFKSKKIAVQLFKIKIPISHLLAIRVIKPREIPERIDKYD